MKKLNNIIHESDQLITTMKKFRKHLESLMVPSHGMITLNLKQVCDRLKISRSTLLRYLDEGKIPKPLKKQHRTSKLFWREVDILKYENELNSN